MHQLDVVDEGSIGAERAAVFDENRRRFHWQVEPARWWLRMFATSVERNHSRVMQLGFRALDAHLSQARAA